MHAPARRDRYRSCEDIGLNLVGHAGHHSKVPADALVMRDVEIVKLGTVVVTEEPRHLLKMSRFELNYRAGAETVGLLAARNEGLPKEAPDRLSTVEAQVTRAGAKAEELIRPGRSQPLKLHRQLGTVEVFADLRGRRRLRWQRGRNHLELRDSLAVGRSQPTVV
jgi:hypothetical protein